MTARRRDEPAVQRAIEHLGRVSGCEVNAVEHDHLIGDLLAVIQNRDAALVEARMWVREVLIAGDVEDAIAVIQESRESHVGWIGHDVNTCDECKARGPAGLIGGDEHHRLCIEKYDRVLALLNWLRVLLAWAPEATA